ncbi:MAG: SMC-Scp complex subunit ScpB [bacterium]|nr:SMC-Scp complex subunit ScpB [bacterium]
MLARPNHTIGRKLASRFQSSGRPQKYWSFIHYMVAAQPDGEFVTQSPAESEPTSKIRRVEAVLFVAREGISSRKLAKLAGLADATEARTLIRHLNQRYVETGRAFRVEEVAGGFALMTDVSFATWLRRLGTVPGVRKLSQASLETLALVAYRQPVQRAEIEAIRGVSCSEVLKQLMELELIRISGRSEELGRPYLYGTTKRFLQMFGLRSVDRLPRMSWVNEPVLHSSITLDLASTQSEAEDSAMTHSTVADTTEKQAVTDLANTVLLSEASELGDLAPNTKPLRLEDDDEDYFDDEEDEDYDDEDYDDEGDDAEEEEWDDEESEEGEDEEEEDDDIEEGGEWEEVDDDDDGWVDDDEEEEEDDEEEDDAWGDDDIDDDEEEWD